MVTLTGVLAAKLATPATVFPYATYTLLDGVKLNNANGEECGGTLEVAFAVSCNSVFAPLGVKLGAGKLVAAAEGFGFNHPSGLPGASESTLPPAAQIQGELDVGSTRDRPGRGPRDATADGDRGRDDRRRRAASAPYLPRRCPRGHERTRGKPNGGSHRAPSDDRRCALRHRHRGGDPRRHRGRQDRHRRTEDDLHGQRSRLSGSRPQGRGRRLPGSEHRSQQHRRLVRRVRARAEAAHRGRA